jgi:hypothetical protein
VRKLVLLAAALLVLPSCAQVFNLKQDRVQMAQLDGLMRFHTGDDPLWSQPGLDDSAWPLISSESDWSMQGYKDYGGFAWYRFKVILPPGHAQLGLSIPPIRTSYRVFADGKMVGSFGGFPPKATIYDLHRHLVLLPQNQAGEMEIAIRVWHWPHWAMFYGGGFPAPPRIGDVDQLKHWMTLQDRDTFWTLTAQNISALLNFLYCVSGFALLLMRPKERLYLWYALTGSCFCAQPLLDDYGAFHDLPQFAIDGLTNGFMAAGFFSFLVFVWMMTAKRNKIWIWIGVAYLALNAMMWTVPALLSLPVSVGNLILTAANFVLTTSPFILLFQAARIGDPDARLLLIPVGFNTLANWINGALWVIFTAGYAWIEPYWTLWSSTFNWPFPFGLYDLSIWILLLAILGIVVLRFARSRHEEDVMKSEMEAARAVQQVLVPAENQAIPGFRIESMYQPAGEVGGDFFQTLPTPAGGVLLVIGDVSGKGMPAAMTVSLLVGTVRTLAHYTQSPSEILHAMNQRMLARSNGGFTTCLVVRLDADGTLTMANAGHLAPYLNGEELPIESGLPLGLAADSEYAERSFRVEPESRLTLMTDGVIEARNARGELFGFERTAAIAASAAEDIARAAQAFGQEDDITVLAVTLAPWEVAHG